MSKKINEDKKRVDVFPQSGIKWDLSMDPAAIKKIIREYFKQVYKQIRKLR